jgi:hypothetical protein
VDAVRYSGKSLARVSAAKNPGRSFPVIADQADDLGEPGQAGLADGVLEHADRDVDAVERVADVVQDVGRDVGHPAAPRRLDQPVLHRTLQREALLERSGPLRDRVLEVDVERLDVGVQRDELAQERVGHRQREDQKRVLADVECRVGPGADQGVVDHPDEIGDVADQDRKQIAGSGVAIAREQQVDEADVRRERADDHQQEDRGPKRWA